MRPIMADDGVVFYALSLHVEVTKTVRPIVSFVISLTVSRPRGSPLTSKIVRR